MSGLETNLKNTRPSPPAQSQDRDHKKSVSRPSSLLDTDRSLHTSQTASLSIGKKKLIKEKNNKSMSEKNG